MFIKGFGIASSAGDPLSRSTTYVFKIVIVVRILVQVNSLNKELGLLLTNV